MRKVLLLSAYEALSHRHWQSQLECMFPDWQWQVLSLPPRHFNWRIRGNPLYWSVDARDVLSEDYDAVVATSMVDLATLRGLVPDLTRTLNCLYYHENQFAYPTREQQSGVLEAQMVSLYSALAADRVAFNSAFNRRTFLEGVGALLDRLPDFVPAGVVDMLTEKARVVPVPIAAPDTPGVSQWPAQSGEDARAVRIAWPGRFEYDKGPDVLLHALRHLEATGLSYELALVGQEFRALPPSFTNIQQEFAHRIVHWGYLPEQEQYHALLGSADVVLSTALHEFQGLAVLEACTRGAIPVVPARQVYPEQFSRQYCYSVDAKSAPEEGHVVADKLVDVIESWRSGALHAPDVTRFHSENLAGDYRAFLTE